VGTAIVTTTSIAVDDECVYWSNDDNTIWAAPLPR
jgi:hypothetical protein